MFKRIILGLCFLVFFGTPAFADSAPISEQEQKEVELFFNSYVNSANSWQNNLINFYTKNANIKRVVIKSNGEKKTVTIPMNRYIKEIKKGQLAAKLAKYKNRYENKKYEKISQTSYKLTAKRYPRNDTKGLSAEFTITKTPNGYKITEEELETTVQKFLTEK